MLATYYLIFSMVDCLLMMLGNKIFRKNADFECFNGSCVVPLNDAGAVFLISYTILILLYSLMIWVIFYKIPEQYGLI
jgi:hypothetical protein